MTQSPIEVIRQAQAEGGDSEPAPVDLGARVRQLRTAQGWTLAAAAERAGLARSTLSKIENGQMSPTFDAVKKLAQGLEISVPQLFSPHQGGSGAARLDSTKAGEGQALITTTYEHDLLAQDRPGKAMLPYRTRIRARNIEEFDGWVRHEGEEFLFVLTGVVQLYTEHFEPLELRRGDSAYYDAQMGHNVISVSQDDATVLWVTSLP